MRITQATSGLWNNLVIQWFITEKQQIPQIWGNFYRNLLRPHLECLVKK